MQNSNWCTPRIQVNYESIKEIYIVKHFFHLKKEKKQQTDRKASNIQDIKILQWTSQRD